MLFARNNTGETKNEKLNNEMRFRDCERVQESSLARYPVRPGLIIVHGPGDFLSGRLDLPRGTIGRVLATVSIT